MMKSVEDVMVNVIVIVIVIVIDAALNLQVEI